MCVGIELTILRVTFVRPPSGRSTRSILDILLCITQVADHDRDHEPHIFDFAGLTEPFCITTALAMFITNAFSRLPDAGTARFNSSAIISFYILEDDLLFYYGPSIHWWS